VCKMFAEDGFVLGCEHEIVGEASRKFCELTGNERVTWVNTGTEATTLAMRLCRLHTGRSKIVIFFGSYHGHFDGFLGMPQSLKTPDKCFPTAPGISRGFVSDLVMLEYDSAESLEWIDAHSKEIAGVYCETIQNRNPKVVPTAFLQKLRHLTLERGIVLVFDEIVTGFRIGPGGAQQNLGIRADLVSYGKALGGGMPVGALGGRAEIMVGVDGGVWQYGDASAPAGRRTYFAGTTCKHPLVMAGVRAVLDHIMEHGESVYTALNAKMERLATTVNAWWAEKQLDLHIANYGSQFKIVVAPNLATLFFQTLNLNGVYCWEGRTNFLYTTHTEDDVDGIINALKRTTLALLEHNVAVPTLEVAGDASLADDKQRNIL
jgi:iturin family lipopeptide synthetase A